MLGQNGTSPILAHTDEIQLWSTCRQSGVNRKTLARRLCAAPDPKETWAGLKFRSAGSPAPLLSFPWRTRGRPGANETTRVHHAARRRCSRLAARGARAAAAPDWRHDRPAGGRSGIEKVARGVPATAPVRVELRRRSTTTAQRGA